MNTIVRYKLIHPNAKPPTKATAGSAGFDLYTAAVQVIGDMHVIDTGLSVAFPRNMVMKVFLRSGWAKKGYRLANGVGIIDSDYRGSIQLMVQPPDFPSDRIEIGDRIGQAVFLELPDVVLQEADDLPESARGSRGFGSSGK